MPFAFKTQLASCVLITPASAPGVILHPDVLAAIGGQPTSVVQVPEFAVADFPNFQISSVGQAPQRHNLSITEHAVPEPSERLTGVAKIAFALALAEQVPIALGVNFVRVASLSSGDEPAGRFLRELLRDRAIQPVENSGRYLVGAGIKLFYDETPWRVTLTIEPDANNPRQILSSVNFHTEKPSTNEVDQLIGQVGRLYGSFSQMLEQVLGESVDVATR